MTWEWVTVIGVTQAFMVALVAVQAWKEQAQIRATRRTMFEKVGFDETSARKGGPR